MGLFANLLGLQSDEDYDRERREIEAAEQRMTAHAAGPCACNTGPGYCRACGTVAS